MAIHVFKDEDIIVVQTSNDGRFRQTIEEASATWKRLDAFLHSTNSDDQLAVHTDPPSIKVKQTRLSNDEADKLHYELDLLLPKDMKNKREDGAEDWFSEGI